MRRYFFPTADSRSSTPAPGTPLGSGTPKPGTPLNLQEYLLSNTPDGAVSGPSGTFSHLGRAYYGLDEEGFSDDSRDIVVHRAEVRLHGGTTAPIIQCFILWEMAWEWGWLFNTFAIYLCSIGYGILSRFCNRRIQLIPLNIPRLIWWFCMCCLYAAIV